MSQISHVATTCNREIHLCLCKAEEQDDSEEETTGKKKCLVSLVKINFADVVRMVSQEGHLPMVNSSDAMKKHNPFITMLIGCKKLCGAIIRFRNSLARIQTNPQILEKLMWIDSVGMCSLYSLYVCAFQTET